MWAGRFDLADSRREPLARVVEGFDQQKKEHRSSQYERNGGEPMSRAKSI
jgi:hypothetical protein